MFSLKLNLLFASWKDVKIVAMKLNKPRHSDMDPRALQAMRAELHAAREHGKLMGVLYRNRIL